MKHEKYILAIDHGTSGVKSSIISVYGRVLDFEFDKTPICFLPGGGAEQDPEDWWCAVIKTSRRLVQKGLVDKDDIVAISVSSTFSSTVAVGKDGNHLMNAITWMDTRGGPYVKTAMKGIPSILGYGLMKVLKFLPRTGGAPTLSGKDDIGHVLLIKHEFPGIYEKTHMFLPSKDYLNLKFTGEFAASHDSMHLFWVTDIRDIHNIRYDDNLIKHFGIDKSKLPPLKASTDILGTVKDDIAHEIGLGKNTRVVVGSPDHQTACIGAGAVRDFQGHIYIGTSSWVQCMVPFKKTDIFHSIASFPTAIPGKYQSVNEQDIAGGCLNFLLDNVIYNKDGLCTGDLPEDVFSRLNDMANSVPAGSHKLIFTPWLNGERTPVDDETIRGGLYNISKTTTRNHIIRACMEGVAYNTRWSLRYVERFIHRKMNPLNMVGGGAKSGIWCQIFADVLDREVRQVKHPLQANARGAAFIASVGLGYIRFDDIPDLIEYDHTYSPNADNRKIYDQLYKEFVGIYKSTKAMCKRLNSNE